MKFLVFTVLWISQVYAFEHAGKQEQQQQLRRRLISSTDLYPRSSPMGANHQAKLGLSRPNMATSQGRAAASLLLSKQMAKAPAMLKGFHEMKGSAPNGFAFKSGKPVKMDWEPTKPPKLPKPEMMDWEPASGSSGQHGGSQASSSHSMKPQKPNKEKDKPPKQSFQKTDSGKTASSKTSSSKKSRPGDMDWE
ncbi:MAG: hypothetical protein GOMPHAMPRED_001352 [Gomphillus americanus]|uniref:Secreted protein n=1 Tax=Gomphillus americanus TaxID=1940652 RepID=A0A8H3FBE0_9LECA|nr:MAG: hypothetical protein GOMPHAMPRED_001352 [Gomphillus americanus]